MVRTASKWELVTYSFKSSDDDANHLEWWEKSVAEMVVGAWFKKSSGKKAQLLKDLELLSYAFPRGRLSKLGKEYMFLHGADLTRRMGVSKLQIESAFGVSDHCRWEFDEHEQCLEEDKEEIRRLLKIQENWNAVCPGE